MDAGLVRESRVGGEGEAHCVGHPSAWGARCCQSRSPVSQCRLVRESHLGV
jgi:hypothetical protein